MTALRISALAAALGLLAACADGPSGPAGPIPVSSVVVQADTTPLTIGATRRLTATAYAADGSVLSGRAVAWSAGDTTVASVAQDGTVMARGAGTVTIRAASEGRSGEATLRIVPATRVVERVEIVPGGTLATRVGNVHQLAVRAFGGDGSEIHSRPVTWTTSDAAIASVEPTGQLFGRGIGRAAVTATVDGRAATLVVEVASQVVRVEMDPDSASIHVGDVFRIYATPWDEGGNLPNLPAVWASSDSSVVTVVAPGRVTGRAPGKATITATIGGTVGRAIIVVSERVGPGS